MGVSAATGRRWVAAKSCPYWTPETFHRIVRSLSERRHDVIIDQLDHSKIPPGAMREIRRLQAEAS